MKLYNILLLSILCLIPAVSMGMNIESAKNLADKSEASLSAEDSNRLLEAQTIMINKAMPLCIQTTGEGPTKSFLVVVEIDKNGKINRSWLQGSYALSECFEKGMKTELSFKPEKAPFYTSFDYKI